MKQNPKKVLNLMDVETEEERISAEDPKVKFRNNCKYALIGVVAFISIYIVFKIII